MTTTCLEPQTSGSAAAITMEALPVRAARAACALEKSIQRLGAGDQNLGHLERQAAHDVQALLRQSVERGAQAKADATPPVCPVCQQQQLSRLSHDQARTLDTRFGSITVKRTRGYCKRCRKWRVPADTALGLEETSGYSPAVQDMAQ